MVGEYEEVGTKNRRVIFSLKHAAVLELSFHVDAVI